MNRRARLKIEHSNVFWQTKLKVGKGTNEKCTSKGPKYDDKTIDILTDLASSREIYNGRWYPRIIFKTKKDVAKPKIPTNSFM
jgi:hypothetical protein